MTLLNCLTRRRRSKRNTIKNPVPDATIHQLHGLISGTAATSHDGPVTACVQLIGGGVAAMDSFMSWIGGKKALRSMITASFPVHFERYIEVFGGAGWVLFCKQPGNHFEVFNDYNGYLTNLYRCVRDQPQELIERLRFVLNSRVDFERIKKTLSQGACADAVERAAMFYQLIRYSYASGLKSYAGQPHDIWANFPSIEQAHRRLAKVVIENKDFEKVIRQYDRPESFFYLDPPYYETEGYYFNVGEGGFTPQDHIRLCGTLMGMEGKFLLSYNDHPYIGELYGRPGIWIERVSRINNIRQRYDGGCLFDELLIANYNMRERANRQPTQISLFDYEKQAAQDET